MIHLPQLERRNFLGGALASFPLALLGQSTKAATDPAIAKVSAGEDRLGEHHITGISTTAYKVFTTDSSGALFLFEHRNAAGKKGGPPLDICTTTKMNGFMSSKVSTSPKSARRVELKPGDSILGPREVPHAWAFVGDTPGRVLIAFTPANKMESFFRDNEKRREGGKYVDDLQIYHAYGMELLGPPLQVK